MVGIDDGEDRMVHVAVLCAAGNVEKLELYSFSIGRHFPLHV